MRRTSACRFADRYATNPGHGYLVYIPRLSDHSFSKNRSSVCESSTATTTARETKTKSLHTQRPPPNTAESSSLSTESLWYCRLNVTPSKPVSISSCQSNWLRSKSTFQLPYVTKCFNNPPEYEHKHPAFFWLKYKKKSTVLFLSYIDSNWDLI